MHPHRHAYCTPLNLVFIVQASAMMITCFGSSILVSLLALCSLHKKRGTQCKGTLPVLSMMSRLERIGRLCTPWTPLSFLSTTYYSLCLPPSLLSSLQLNQLSHQKQTHASHLLVSSPAFLSRFMDISLLLSVLKLVYILYSIIFSSNGLTSNCLTQLDL